MRESVILVSVLHCNIVEQNRVVLFFETTFILVLARIGSVVLRWVWRWPLFQFTGSVDVAMSSSAVNIC